MTYQKEKNQSYSENTEKDSREIQNSQIQDPDDITLDGFIRVAKKLNQEKEADEDAKEFAEALNEGVKKEE